MSIIARVLIGATATVAAALFSLMASADGIYYHNDDHHFHKKIVGRWGFTTDQTCARSVAQPPGTVSIDPTTRQFNVDVDIVDMSGSGEMTFDRDGRFTLVGHTAAELDKSVLTAGATPVHDGFFPVCEGEYQMTGGNSYSVEFNCNIDVPTMGIQIAAGPVLAEGYVANDGSAITMNLLQNIQTLTAYVNGNPVGERQRICLQRFALVRTGRK